MIADVLVPQGTWGGRNPRPLFTYLVPQALAAELQPGHLVLVPFGPKLVQGIVWKVGEEAGARPDELALREIAGLLDAMPILLPHQQALAEWLADYYCASLTNATLVMVPPRLESGARLLWRGDAEGGEAEAREQVRLRDASTRALAGLLREKGKLDEKAVRKAVGGARASTAIAELVEQGLAELAPAHLRTQRARVVRLAVSYEEAARWHETAQQQLEQLSLHQAPGLRKQLAVMGLLLATSPRTASAQAQSRHWTLTEVRKTTRATAATLAALQRLGLIQVEEAEIRHDPVARRKAAHSAPLELTSAQRQAVERILAASAAAVFLLHGITGSGKTEVYLQTLAAVIARRQQGIVLVPEIALTPQAVERFAGRFPGRVAVLHSELSDLDRYDQWRKIRAGEVDVVVGSRSAIFAPLPKLGLIVLDEEHESAYKQENDGQGYRLPYHARDVAIALGRLTGAQVVLGSATPSTESYYAAQSGRYVLLELPMRVGQAERDTPQAPAPEPTRDDGRDAGASQNASPGLTAQHAGLPMVTIVDLRAELRAGNTGLLSRALYRGLVEVLEGGQQAILFLNRRGMASSVMCRNCGYVALCPHCDIALTYHATEHALICHYCYRHEEPPEMCPICVGVSLRYAGQGTERIEEAVQRLFPRARLLRWDRDTARGRHGHERLLEAFANHQADILIGTQMIAKGLDLPSVTLVGVIAAETALYLPDYRTAERAFQLLTQVAGRAGRGAAPGRVIFQTFTPEHFCIQAAAEHNYREFYEAEIMARRQYGYPPFRRFVKLTYSHKDRYTAQVEATSLSNTLTQLIAELGLPDTDLVGPAPAFLERLRENYRWQIIIRGPDLRPLLREVAPEDLPYGWSVDIDPMNTL
jgi:primosomal protein N' (replication factor Y)